MCSCFMSICLCVSVSNFETVSPYNVCMYVCMYVMYVCYVCMYVCRGGSRTLEKGVRINKCALAREILRDHAHFYSINHTHLME